MQHAWRRPWRALSVGALALSGIAAGGGALIGSAVVVSTPASASPPACTDSWKTATSGNWDTPTNWSTGAVPGSSDVACITVPGTYTVTYQPSSGSESVDSLVLGSGATSDQETLNVQGTCSDNVTLVTKNTTSGTDTDLISSTGHLSLTSSGCGNASTLSIGTTLVNQGTISTDAGAGNGGRTVTGNVTNSGTVDINASATFTGGTWDNAGALNIATAQTLTVGTSPSTFTDDTGGSVVTTGTGELAVDGGDTYNQGNGTTSGNAMLLGRTGDRNRRRPRTTRARVPRPSWPRAAPGPSMEPSGPIRCSRSTAPVRTTRSRRSTRARRTPAPCTSARRGVATTPRSPLARVIPLPTRAPASSTWTAVSVAHAQSPAPSPTKAQ